MPNLEAPLCKASVHAPSGLARIHSNRFEYNKYPFADADNQLIITTRFGGIAIGCAGSGSTQYMPNEKNLTWKDNRTDLRQHKKQ